VIAIVRARCVCSWRCSLRLNTILRDLRTYTRSVMRPGVFVLVDVHVTYICTVSVRCLRTYLRYSPK